MDRNSGRSSSSRVITPKKGDSVGSKDATAERDQNARFCNRIGCSGRIKYINQNPKTGIPEKAKCYSPSFHSPNGNKMIANSSNSSSAPTRAKGSNLDSKRKLSSRLESNPSESSQSGDSEASTKSSPSRGPTKHHLGSVNKSNVPSNDRSQKMFQKKPESNGQNTSSASSTPVCRNSGLGTLNTSNRSRLGLKNLKCNSVRDVSSASSSSSQSQSTEKNVMKKRSTVGNSTLSSRGIEMASTEGNLSSRGREKMAVNGHRFSSASVVSSSTSAISSSSSSSSSSGSRYAYGKANNGAASVSKQRSMNVNNSRTRLLSNRQNGNNSSSPLRESANRVSQFPDSGLRVNVGWESSPVHNANGSSSSWSSYSHSSSNYDNRRFNVDSEVLLALERMEQGEELTSEQFRLLEGSFFLGDLTWSDQHRDMRLDIDNMSYEELLALGEMMGTVSTALSEDALSQCIRRSRYEATPSEVVTATESGNNGDGIKCSICQEEYVEGDELGMLVDCKHDYHMTCINEWLRLKNWCPICKADLKAKLPV